MKKAKAERPGLLLQTEFLHQSTVRALVVYFQVLQMLAAVSDKAQKTPAAVFILAIFIQMDRKFRDSACKYGYLHFRRPRIGVMAACFLDLVVLFALRKHLRMISHSLH